MAPDANPANALGLGGINLLAGGGNALRSNFCLRKALIRTRIYGCGFTPLLPIITRFILFWMLSIFHPS